MFAVCVKLEKALLLPKLAISSLSVVHMCSLREHNCAHFCINTPGSYVCRCKQGYILNSDQTTCRSKIALLMYLYCPPLLSSSLFFYLGSFICGPSPNRVINPLKKQMRFCNSYILYWSPLPTLPPQHLGQSRARGRPSGRVRKMVGGIFSEIASLNSWAGVFYFQAVLQGELLKSPFIPGLC